MTAPVPTAPTPLTVEITAEDVTKFLTAKGVPGECEICKVNNWAMVHEFYPDDSPRNIVIPAIVGVPIAGGFSIPPPNVPVVLMACHNCGNVRAHSRVVIGQWKLGAQK